MGPEDQHPWDREDEEIRQAFSAKDAEIERLKEENSALENSLVEQDFEIERMKKELHDAGVRNGQLVLQLREKDLVIETMNEAHL